MMNFIAVNRTVAPGAEPDRIMIMFFDVDSVGVGNLAR
jgi:hypothetical protein